MEIKKIYFDMDGVLVDFRGGVRDICGLDPDVDDDTFWPVVRHVEHFYGMLQPHEEALEFFRKIRNAYGDKVEILSAIPKPVRGVQNAEADKRQWIREQLGEDIQVNICFRSEKKDYALGEGYILIDDTVKNIREWNEKGATGIFYTNVIDAETALETLLGRNDLPDETK